MKYLLIILSYFVLTSCSTNNPQIISDNVLIEKPISKIIIDTEPSFDKNEQNSGIISFIDGKGWLITERAAARYNKLIELYGKTLTPSIHEGFGLTKYYNNFLLTQEGMVNFALLNQKLKSAN